ncbi:MAG: cytochrome c [Desulfobacterales bacterium]|nr:cytochrome c [Desulfobacterales bacterium]
MKVRQKRSLILCGVLLFPALMILVFNYQGLFAAEGESVAGQPARVPTENQPATGAGNLSPSPTVVHQPDQAFLLPKKIISPLTRQAQNGKVLYEYYCALCHGQTGNADGFNAYALRTMGMPPAKHSDPSYMRTLSDAHIGQVIRGGGTVKGRSSLMPPWGGVLSDKEIYDLISFLRTLAQPGSGKVQP